MATRIRKAEQAIEQTEQQIAALQEQLQQPEVQTDYQKITELSAAIDEQQTALEKLMEDWEQAQLEMESMV